MTKCKFKLNEQIYLEEVTIPAGIYDGYENGPGGGWPIIIYEGKEYDFVSDDIDMEVLR